MPTDLLITPERNQDLAREQTTLQPHRATWGSNLCQRLVVRAFQRMQNGCLVMRLPSGEALRFGTTDAPPDATITVMNPRFFRRCVLHGDIGFGESYVDGDWETPDIRAVIEWFIKNLHQAPSMSGSRVRFSPMNLLRALNRYYHLRRPNSVNCSRSNIREHYDLGNEFYRLWLDPTMTYSSAWFSSPELSLEQAQVAKYDALCRKLRLKPTDHVLEIGSGWGGFSRHAVKNYGCQVTTLTLSEEQHRHTQELFNREGLADRAQVRLQDYRHVTGSFDKIASIEMLEAVGDAYLETYFRTCHQLLRPHGLVGLQFITCPDSRYDQLRTGVDWIQKHIFPGSLLLSLNRITQALRSTGDLEFFELTDMGLSYARTLALWAERFNARQNEIEALGFDERFRRKWNYYLRYCEAAFARRNISVVQTVLTRPNNPSLMEAGR